MLSENEKEEEEPIFFVLFVGHLRLGLLIAVTAIPEN